MSLYLDASVLVALLVIDPTSTRATTFLASHPAIVVADFGAAEFSSAGARRVRTRHLTRDDGQLAFLNFNAWVAWSASRQEITSADVGAFARILRRLDVNLRTPDTIHIAIAQRMEVLLVTFDHGMAAAARVHGMAVAMP